jgi:hypothetical protein
MLEYERLLQDGQNQLKLFRYLQSKKRESDEKEVPTYSGDTGIEESLVSPYLEQMICLNKYVYTDASANYPDDPYFQHMFVSGWIRKDQITFDLLTKLESNRYSYHFFSYTGFQKNWTSADRQKKLILHDMMTRYWFGMLVPLHIHGVGKKMLTLGNESQGVSLPSKEVSRFSRETDFFACLRTIG